MCEISASLVVVGHCSRPMISSYQEKCSCAIITHPSYEVKMYFIRDNNRNGPSGVVCIVNVRKTITLISRRVTFAAYGIPGTFHGP